VCRDALFLTDPNVDRESLLSVKGTRVAGTCEWIRQNGSYQSWLRGSTHLLWISGGPGKGKTMLSIFLTEELERITQNMEDGELLFYFCSHQDEKRNTVVAILRGLVHQIIAKRPKLVNHVLPYFETPKKVQLTLSSPETLWIIFRRLVQDVDLGTIFCVLDGLDECDEDTLKALIPKIVDMFSPENSQPTAKLQLVIVSRDIAGLQGCAQVKLDPDNDKQVAGDIELFISVKVKELLRIEGFNEEFSTIVQKTLLERSEGTFLWVGFVINELSRKKTCTEVLETLRTLPRGLPAIYSRILLQIESGRRRTSSVILCWVTTAVRPLMLQELAAAMGIQSSALITTEQAVRDQVALCGLLKVQEQEVILVHQSAREYLLRKEPDSDAVLEGFRIKPKEAHLELSRTCLDTVAHSALQYAPLNLDDGFCSQESPLLKYAALYWPEHARCSSTLATELFDLSRSFFQKDSGLRKNWWETYRRAEPWVPATLPLLHMACYLGIVPWVRPLPSKSWMPWLHKPADKKDKYGRTPLSYAAENGHEAVVKLLLAKDGVRINSKCDSRQTPLSYAAENGHEAVVKLLLAKDGVDINSKEWFDRRTPLSYAAENGDEAVVKLLLAKDGVDINSKCDSRRTPLSYAAEDGHEAVVKLLLAKDGVNIHSKDDCGRTPLLHAAENGHEAVMRLLLAKDGVGINSKDSSGRTPLSHAAENGHEAVMRLLLAKDGVGIYSKDIYGRTPLSYAAQNGHETVVKLLLAKDGVSINSKDDCGRTPLSHAAENGHEAVVKLLRER
jgi:ankyrin repeat protein